MELIGILEMFGNMLKHFKDHQMCNRRTITTKYMSRQEWGRIKSHEKTWHTLNESILNSWTMYQDIQTHTIGYKHVRHCTTSKYQRIETILNTSEYETECVARCHGEQHGTINLCSVAIVVSQSEGVGSSGLSSVLFLFYDRAKYKVTNAQT